ncbi:hypothetical protein KC949_01035 [Candidatus Saccharibacteria bacterium]|nr:hypothetical protein [Candidatus Saccharibacteria bacterium]
MIEDSVNARPQYGQNYEIEKVAEAPNFYATHDPELIKKAQQLTARTYLQRKFITPSEVGPDGTMTPESDPYADHATYYVMTVNGGQDVAGTMRIIHYNHDKGADSFPMMKYFEQYTPEMQQKIMDIGLENIFELSSLVRDRELDANGEASMGLYKQMYIDAINSGNNNLTGLLALNPYLYKQFEVLFRGTLKRLGPDLPYPGQDASPALLNFYDTSMTMISQSRDRKNPYRGVHEASVGYFLNGLSYNEINPDVVDKLIEHGYDEYAHNILHGDWGDEAEVARQTMRDIKKGFVIGKVRECVRHYRPEILVSAGLLAYTAARTGVVAEAMAPVSDVDWRVFLAAELVTIPPYVWGVGDLARNAGDPQYGRTRKLGAYAAAGASFVTPYAYLAVEGGMSSQQGIVAAGGLAAMAAVPAVAKKVRKAIKSRKK